MSITRFVPRPRAPIDCQISLPPLDDALLVARESLSAAIHSNNTQTIEIAFTNYETIATEVTNVYRTMDLMQIEIQQAVDAVCLIINEYMNRMLNDADQKITKACRSIESCEASLALFATIPQDHSVTHVQQIEGVCEALINFVTTMATTNAELASAITNAESVCSLAWRQHAYTTSTKLRSHRHGEIPATMRTQLMATIGRGWSIRPQSSLADVAWNYFNQTPLGVKLGMLARYSCDHSQLMLEQLLVEQKYSLFDERIYRRLTQMLYEKPNSSLVTHLRIPLLALAYSLRLRTNESDQDFVESISRRSISSLYTIINKRCDVFLPNSVITEDESKNFRIPHTVAFFSMSDLFVKLAHEIEIDGTSRLKCTTDTQRSLYDMMRCLVFFKNHESKLLLASRLWFWSRYANREGADEMQFWKWSLKKDRLKKDLFSFYVESSFLGGSHWRFSPDCISQ